MFNFGVRFLFSRLLANSLAALLCFVAQPTVAKISNDEANRIAKTVIAEYNDELSAQPTPFRYQFDRSPSKGGLFSSFFGGMTAAHIAPTSEVKSDGTINVSNVLSVNGYLPSLPGMDRDTFALTICHELGHVIGGAPVMHPFKEMPNHEYSIEGQADYFASAKCFKRYAQKHPNVRLKLPSAALKKCGQVYKTSNEQKLCARTMMAGLNLMNATRPENERESSLDAKSPTLNLNGHNNEHPKTACRVETFVAGALCDADAHLPPSKTDPNSGYCEDSAQARRPSCWYNRNLVISDLNSAPIESTTAR